MRIILDMDSILADILPAWLDESNRLFGERLTVADVTDWDMSKLSKGGKAIFGILAKPGFFSALKPIPGAIEATKALHDSGHEVFVVTAAEFPCNFSEKAEWFREHLPFLGKRRFVMAHEKHLLAADAIVDDGPHNAEAYKKAHPHALAMTIGYAYNRDCPHYDLIAGDHSDTRAAWAQITERLM